MGSLLATSAELIHSRTECKGETMINSQTCSNHKSVFLIEDLYKDRPKDWTCPGEDVNLACTT
jgi:hypothetical protein